MRVTKTVKLNGSKRFVWAVEFEIDEKWIEDGFDLTEDRAFDIISSHLAFAYGHELGAKVIAAPSPKEIRKAQGYND